MSVYYDANGNNETGESVSAEQKSLKQKSVKTVSQTVNQRRAKRSETELTLGFEL